MTELPLLFLPARLDAETMNDDGVWALQQQRDGQTAGKSDEIPEKSSKGTKQKNKNVEGV